MYSETLIKEYQYEMQTTYGVFVNDAEAQIQLRTLVRSMFSTVIAEQKTESREQGARKGSVSLPACTGSLSVTLSDDGESKVGASITPTLGQWDKK